MKAMVNEETCIGCGVCAETCPEVFVMDDEAGLARVIAAPVPPDAENACPEAAERCPVEAISIQA